MKYIKLFLLLAVAALGFSACSDDDNEWNSTASTTVSLPTDTIRIKENAGLYRIPVTVTGARNGKVKVTVNFEETGANPAIADSNYYATSNTAVVSADTTDSEGFIEIETVDDDEINTDRTFRVTITSAEGAQIGNASTVVVLRDNDAEFYDKLQGKWTMTATSRSGSAIQWDVTVTGAADESDADYNKTLYITGMMGYSWTVAELSYHFDASTQQGYVAFDNLGGYFFAEEVNFGLGGYNNVVPYRREGRSLTDNPITGTWSSDFKTVTFEEDGMLYLDITDASGTSVGYVWNQFDHIKLSK